MQWSPDIAYIVGLITTDGSLSKDGRHINLTSKDVEQIETFARILHLNNKIGIKKSSYNPSGTYYQIQFGDVEFYRFLLNIGLKPNKTKSLSVLRVPNRYFADFLRGYLDGDGFTYSYWDKRWKNSFMLYTGFISASKSHLEWMREKISLLYKVDGKIKFAGKSVFQLVYAKHGSILLLKEIYYDENVPCLSRKKIKVDNALKIIKENADVLELVDRHA